MTSLLLRIIFVVILAGAGFAWYTISQKDIKGVNVEQPASTPAASEEVGQSEDVEPGIIEIDGDKVKISGAGSEVDQEIESTTTKVEVSSSYQIKNVPFLVQAPEAQWDDPKFQDACEEASVLMAHWWRTGSEGLEGAAATAELEKFFNFESVLFDNPDLIDTSAADTALMMEKRYDYKPLVISNVTKNKIIREIAQNRIVIVPADGTKLDNEYFTGDGPERHMLVITGYDLSKGIFITNEPGTKRGQNYEYTMDNLMEAIGDYETGNKVELPQERSKQAIVVGK